MKLHWGWGVGLLYGGFVAMIGVMVMLSINLPVDLVTEKYYEEEIQFQQKIDRINRANALPEKVKWRLESGKLFVQFPASLEKPTGQIRFYCPSNSGHDKAVVITEKTQTVDLATLPKGHYKLQIDWKVNDQAYWNEDVLNLP